MSDVRTSAMRGIAWTALSFGIRHGFQTVISILVARVLLPEDYGVYAMASLSVAILALFRNLGLSSALIRQPEIDERHLSSTFWFNAGLGVLLAGVLILAAPAVAGFFGTPGLRVPLLLLAPTFLLNTVTAVHGAILGRRRQYKTFALRETSAAVLSGLVAVTMAYMGFGLYALVAQSIVGSVFSVLFLWTSVDWRPRFVFHWASLSGLFAFGLPLAGSNVLTYFARNLDNLLVGRFLGAAALGLYGFAYGIITSPIAMVQNVLGRVMFPEMSRIQHDLEQMRAVYLSSLRHIAAILWLPLGGLLAMAPVAIPLVYGPQWQPAVVLMQLFLLVALGQVLATTVGWIYSSMGKSRRQFLALITFAGVLYGSFFIGLRWGVLGVTVAYVIANYVLSWPYNQIALSLIGLRMGRVLRELRWLALTLIGMVSTLYILRVAWIELVPDSRWSPWALLLTSAIVGAGVYGLLLWLTEPKLVESLRRLPANLRSARRAKPSGGMDRAAEGDGHGGPPV
jgi:O-antigen/teichoic acid export membrane protein